MNLRDLRERQKESLAQAPGSQVVAVFGPKGGVGKTLLATSIAILSSQKGTRRTLLIDLDLDSGDVSVHMDLPEGKSITDLVPYCSDLRADLLSKFVTHHSQSGVDVVPAPPRPELSELVKPEQVASLIEGARRQYQCVVVDTPPSLDCDILYECLERSDIQVLVVTQDLACLRQSKTSIELLRRLGHNVDDRTFAVINQYRDRSVLTQRKIMEFLGIRRIHTVCEDRDSVDRGILDGLPLVASSESNPVSRDIRSLVSQIMGLPAEAPAKTRTGIPWFTKGRIL